jgi:hypothetical protein
MKKEEGPGRGSAARHEGAMEEGTVRGGGVALFRAQAVRVTAE